MAKQLALIPACLLIPALAFLLRVRRGGDWAWRGCFACCALLYAVSTPLVAGALVGPLQGQAAPLDVAAAAINAQAAGAQAIVVLSAEMVPAPEYGGTTIGPVTLARLRYGARLHRATGLPILVTGGQHSVGGATLAEGMRLALAEDFGIGDAWVEDASATTADNARFSADLLRAHGASRVLLVTSAWHMPRSVRAFEAAGVSVIEAPTNFDVVDEVSVLSLLPSARALHRSYYGLHERLGELAYSSARFWKRLGAARGRDGG